MKRIVLLALGATAFFTACPETSVKCSTSADCSAGEICAQGECRATVGTGSGPGQGGGSGNGGGTGTGGNGGGGGVVMGCDPNAGSANLTRDTDCDGLSDAEEYGATNPTDPCNADSDGDGLSDGLELGKTTSVVASCSFVGDADPNSHTNPRQADSDGDGVPDGTEDANHDGRRQGDETDPTRADTDCDGYSDGEERAGAAGCVTDGTLRDTDGDGLPDGVEGGLTPPGADTMGCTYTAATFDSDSATHTDACNADSDGDGIQDGAEDTNLNGAHDPGELDPKDGADGTGVAQQACATTNLKPVLFHSSGISDVQVALPPSFAELNPVSASAESGFLFYDATNKVAGLAISFTPMQNTATLMETANRGKFGSVSGPLTQTFTTWDGFMSSVRATYDVSGNTDLKAKINEIAQNFLGAGVTGTLSGAAGVTGPFKVVVEYVRRTDTRAVMVVALTQASATGQPVFVINDTAGGTALAQFGDFANTQCEVFDATVNQKVDFLWVVDDSCSMDSSQTAVANAGSIFGAKLSAAGLDWRAGGVSTGWYGGQWDGSARDWTTDLNAMQGWFSGSGKFGTNGSGTEAGFAGAQSFINRSHGGLPTSDFRPDAQGHVIFLTDTREQSNTTASQMQTFLNNYFGGRRYAAHGIICGEGRTCANDDSEEAVGKYHTLIRATGGVIGDILTFNPSSPTPQQQAQQQATIDAIVSAVIGGTGTQLQRPPIASTIKVAVASTRGTCNGADVPRDRTNGWDIDPATRRIVFFGNCIPSAAGVKVAVSYKYWNDASPDANGDACGGTCVAPQVCDPTQRSCVCAPNCGGCGAGFSCNQNLCTCEPELG